MTDSPQTLTVTECHALLNALMPQDCTHKQHKKAVRNYTMALLMLDAGLRVGEVVSLHFESLSTFARPVESLRIPADAAKNNTERIIPLSSRITNAITDMYTHWWSQYVPFPPLYAFYTASIESPLSTRQVERIINAAAWKSIGRPVHPHVLRHTFASRLMRTVNARIVQELLGHKHLTSTQVYTHPNGEDLKNAIHSLENHSAIATDNQDPQSAGVSRPDRADASATNHHHR